LKPILLYTGVIVALLDWSECAMRIAQELSTRSLRR
jgi:hypothetical protein